jgi:MFS family permease
MQVLGIRAAAWLGRGMRGPVRDAILTEAVPAEAVAPAFGFDRAMDTVGAVLGPLAAFLLVPHFGWRTIFALTLVPGVLSVVAFASAPEIARRRTRGAFRASLRELPADYRAFLVAVGVFGLGDFARSLLVLRAADMLPPGRLPREQVAIALYVLHNVVHAASAYGIGLVATRLGARRVLGAGYALFALTCVGFVVAPAHPSVAVLVPLFALAGLALSTEEVLERSVAAELLPAHVRGTGFGALAAVNGIGDLAASAVVGLLWARVSPAAGFIYAAATGVLGAAALARVR